jgi:uncharacterized protein (TIGR03083 family)
MNSSVITMNSPMIMSRGGTCRQGADPMVSGYEPCDVAYWTECLESEGALLGDAAERAGLGARVPGCPGWSVRNLLAHIGYVHRWAADFIASGIPVEVGEPDEEKALAQAPPDGLLPDWYREGHAALVRTLREASPQVRCWTFLPAPSPLAFWARRQAHETAIHRADAEQAAAPGEPVTAHPARLAADGVDELLTGFLARKMKAGRWRGRPGVLGIHASDGAAGRADWLLVTSPDGASVSPGTGPADCDVTAPAGLLYLALWNRGSAGGIDVRGDRGLLADLAGGLRVRWG